MTPSRTSCFKDGSGGRRHRCGGPRKGCNLVVLRGTDVVCSITGAAPEALLGHCLEHDVAVVGIDAPCLWRGDQGARLAERELARTGISLFSTPVREHALANTTGFYGWMFNGERVYQALAVHYPLLATAAYDGGRVAFETFPHAITAAFLGRDVASARLKHTQRRQLLENMGIGTTTLSTIDAIDAAVCAVAAQHLLAHATHAYGDAAGGYIHIPAVATFAID